MIARRSSLTIVVFLMPDTGPGHAAKNARRCANAEACRSTGIATLRACAKRKASTSFLCQPARFHMEFKPHTSNSAIKGGPPHKEDPIVFSRALGARQAGRCDRPYRLQRADPAVGFLLIGGRNQWCHHRGGQKPALARCHRHRLFNPRLQDRATILRRRPCPSTGDTTLQGCQRAARRPGIATLKRIGR